MTPEKLSEEKKFTSSFETPEMLRIWHREGMRHRVSVLDDFDFETAINPDVFENSKEYILFSDYQDLQSQRSRDQERIAELEAKYDTAKIIIARFDSELTTLKSEAFYLLRGVMNEGQAWAHEAEEFLIKFGGIK